MLRATIALSVAAAAGAAGTPLGCTSAPFTSYAFCDAALDTAARVADAVSRMTLQEKIDSMTRPFRSPFVDCHGTSRIASLDGWYVAIRTVSAADAAFLLAHIPPPFYLTAEEAAVGRLLTETAPEPAPAD